MKLQVAKLLKKTIFKSKEVLGWVECLVSYLVGVLIYSLYYFVLNHNNVINNIIINHTGLVIGVFLIVSTYLFLIKKVEKISRNISRDIDKTLIPSDGNIEEHLKDFISKKFDKDGKAIINHLAGVTKEDPLKLKDLDKKRMNKLKVDETEGIKEIVQKSHKTKPLVNKLVKEPNPYEFEKSEIVITTKIEEGKEKVEVTHVPTGN